MKTEEGLKEIIPSKRTKATKERKGKEVV